MRILGLLEAGSDLFLDLTLLAIFFDADLNPVVDFTAFLCADQISATFADFVFLISVCDDTVDIPEEPYYPLLV